MKKYYKCFRPLPLLMALIVGVCLTFGQAAPAYATETSERAVGEMSYESGNVENGELADVSVEAVTGESEEPGTEGTDAVAEEPGETTEEADAENEGISAEEVTGESEEPSTEVTAESEETSAESTSATVEETVESTEVTAAEGVEADIAENTFALQSNSLSAPVIAIEGDASDWGGATEYGENPSWSIATDGEYVYILIRAESSNGLTFSISGTDAPGNALICDWNGNVCNGWWQSISGAQREDSVANGVCELAVPADYFPDKFEITFNGVTVSSDEIQGAEDLATGELEEPILPTEPTVPTVPGGVSGVYEGIEIDGEFDDWSAVAKTSVDENKGWSTVDEVAMVWDGDWVYLYFCAYGEDQGWAITGNWDSVCGAGPHNNGQYVITTDLGRETLIQLVNQNGTPAVSGISDAQVAVNNTERDKAPHMWEVAIPASELGAYQQTISFGIYQGETLVENVADLQGAVGGEFEGIVYDGLYDDWTYYPHTLINYTTSGTQETVVDAEGALYSEGTSLYGHVVTEMPAHLEEAGGEFTSAVTIKINNDTDLEFCPRFIAVDSEGNIDWNPSLSGLADGTYEFYMTSTTVDGTSQNINDLQADDVIYGTMIVTISEGKDEMEFVIDIPTLAANLHSGNGQSKETVSIDPADIKTISAQFGRIGQEWITTAGTSTLPVLNVLLCLAALGLGWFLEKKGRRAGKVRTA